MVQQPLNVSLAAGLGPLEQCTALKGEEGKTSGEAVMEKIR